MSLNTMERSPSPSSDELPRGVEAPFEQPGDGPVDGRVEEYQIPADTLGQEADFNPEVKENLYQENVRKMAEAALRAYEDEE